MRKSGAGVSEGGVGGSGQVTAGSIRCFVREETSYFVSFSISLFFVTQVDRCKGKVREGERECESITCLTHTSIALSATALHSSKTDLCGVRGLASPHYPSEMWSGSAFPEFREAVTGCGHHSVLKIMDQGNTRHHDPHDHHHYRNHRRSFLFKQCMS